MSKLTKILVEENSQEIDYSAATKNGNRIEKNSDLSSSLPDLTDTGQVCKICICKNPAYNKEGNNSATSRGPPIAGKGIHIKWFLQN